MLTTLEDLRARLDERTQLARLLTDLSRYSFSAGTPDGTGETDRAIAARAELRRRLDDGLADVDVSRLEADAVSVLLNELTRLCAQGRLQFLLAQSDIAHPIYDIFADFSANVAGPWDRLPIVPELTTPKNWRLLGREVRFPLGVPASGLTANSRWVEYFSRRGFNVITYKTVRSIEFAPHVFPNWIFIDQSIAWRSFTEIGSVTGDLDMWPTDPTAFSMANSFGVPSPPRSEWQADVERALTTMLDGQLLLVSVMGSVEAFPDDLIGDFVRVARFAEDVGAQAIELNLSCPNTLHPTSGTVMRPICEDPTTTASVVQAVRDALRPNTALVAKLGYLDKDLLEQVVAPIAEYCQGISGINTIQASVTRPNGDPAFVGTAADPGAIRDRAGVSGVAIRDLALEFVEQLNRLRTETNSKFDIIGMGGIMSGRDVRAMLERGADAAQSATAASYNPLLPLDAIMELGIDLPAAATTTLSSVQVAAVMAALADTRYDFRTPEGLADEVGVATDLVRAFLESNRQLVRTSAVPDPAGRALYTLRSRGLTRGERLGLLQAGLSKDLG